MPDRSAFALRRPAFRQAITSFMFDRDKGWHLRGKNRFVCSGKRQWGGKDGGRLAGDEERFLLFRHPAIVFGFRFCFQKKENSKIPSWFEVKVRVQRNFGLVHGVAG
jgi:hypothetical protein